MKRALFLVVAATAAAQTPAEIEGLLSRIATYQYGADPAPLVRLDEAVGRLSGPEQSRRRIEGLLIRFLRSDATPAGKEAVFRQLSIVGSAAAVPVLAPMLAQIDTAEMARYALAAISGPEAGEALRAALSKAPSDRIRIGLINSLGTRRDAMAVTALAALASPASPELSAAVFAALASISDKPALDALAAARKTGAGAFRELASEAMVVCADHFAARGDKVTAASVYRQLLGTGEAPSLRARALKSLSAADRDAALPVLTAELQSKDTQRQVDAIRILDGVAGPAAAKTMAAAYPGLPPVAQIHVLTSLAFRGDAAGKPLATAAAGSADAALRAAGLSALGRVGDASSVRLLADAAAEGQGAAAAAATRSLAMLRGASAEAAIVSALASSTGKVKLALIAAVNERASASAADALVKAASEADAEIRREALRALRNVGGHAQTTALLDLILKAESASDRREAALALAAVAKRSSAPVTPIADAYRNAPVKQARLTLLEVMGQISSAETLPLLRAGIRDDDAEVARAAILALTAWDDATPISDLLTLAKSTQRPAGPEAAGAPAGRGGGRGGPPPTNNLQVLAVRGVLRLAVLDSQRTPAEGGRLLADVMALAALVPEKRAVLGLLPSFPSPESLQVAQAAVKDESVRSEALVAVAQVTEALKAK